MFRNKIIFGFAVVGILGFGLGVYAGLRSPARQDGVPHLIPYHGILEKDGQLVQAVDSETVDFRVSLWDAPAAGNKVWPAADVYDEHSVNVYDGRFAFDIGSDVPYEHVPDTPLYLDVQVRGPGDADFVQLGGRQQLLTAPFAVAAARADGDFPVAGHLSAASLDITGPPLSVQGSDIDSAGTLTLQNTSGSETLVGGDLSVAGDVTAANLWVKVAEIDVSGQSWVTVGGLDGNRQGMYKILFRGYIPGNATDQRVLLRPNNDAAANYRSFVAMDGDGSGGEWDTSGLYLGRTCCGYTGVFNIEYNLNATGAGWQRFTGSGFSTFCMTNGVIIRYRAGGAWVSSSNITSLVILTSGGAHLRGTLTVFALRP